MGAGLTWYEFEMGLRRRAGMELEERWDGFTIKTELGMQPALTLWWRFGGSGVVFYHLWSDVLFWSVPRTVLNVCENRFYVA